MTSIGTGYDLSCTTFSPDGRVFQVEYAAKAVENSGTCIGVRCKDGVVLAVEKLVASKLLVKNSNRRIQTIDTHVGFASAGLLADGRHLAERAQRDAHEYRKTLRTTIPPKHLAEQLAMIVQAYTLYSHVRPFGASVLLAGMDRNGPQLYMIEPSGVYFGYYGCAIGKGKQQAKTEIEKLKFSELSCRDALVEVAKIIHSVHDDNKDKAFELELSWVCTESNGKHQFVPKELADAAETQAKKALEADEMDTA